MAREFNSKPSLIVAHSPSRGLDLKACIVHSNLKKVRVKEGASVILISEDLDEIFLLSNRIAVVHSGRITGIFDRVMADKSWKCNGNSYYAKNV